MAHPGLTLTSGRVALEKHRSFQLATCIVSGRNKTDSNHRAHNYIDTIVVTDAVNVQPSFLPVLQHDCLSL